MNKKKAGLLLGIVALVAVVAMFVGMGVGIGQTAEELSVEIHKDSAEAILASANVAQDTNVRTPVLYYDQKMDACADLYSVESASVVRARQFEWSECGYYAKALETGLVAEQLSKEYLPVATGAGTLTANRGMTIDGFRRWFNAVDGISVSYPSALSLTYADGEFYYENSEFYPLDKFNAWGESWRDGHNHLFTMNLGVPVSVLTSGAEKFEVVADDDTWVYIGDTLVLDMGGVHEVAKGKFMIDKSGEVYAGVETDELVDTGMKLAAGEPTIVRIYHADRDSEDSVFKIRFSGIVLNVTEATLARNGADSGSDVELAYDPSNPSYVAPLGESLTVTPDKTRALIFVITMQSIMVGVLAFVVVFVVARLLKARQEQQEE